MSAQLDVSEVISGLTSVPPRLSALIKPFTVPESMLQDAVSRSGLYLPPGPATTLYGIAESFESQVPAQQLPLPQLPAPPAPAAQAAPAQQAPPAPATAGLYIRGGYFTGL